MADSKFSGLPTAGPLTGGETAAGLQSGADVNHPIGTVAALNVDTDGTLAANSNTKVSPQRAVKTYADAVAARSLGTLVRTAVKTATYGAAASDAVPCDSSGGAFTINLPNAPADNSVVLIKHVVQGASNAITYACAGVDTFDTAGGPTSDTLPLLNQAVLLVYQLATHVWTRVACSLDLSVLDSRYLMLTGPQTVAGTKTFTSAPQVPDAVNPLDAVNLETALALISRFGTRPVCTYASTVALAANTYSNGSSGVGATLTGNVNGALTVDGVALTSANVGQNILVAGESSQSHNAGYVVTQAGDGSHPYILTRIHGWDIAVEFESGDLVEVKADSGVTPGAANDQKVFMAFCAKPFVVGTTAVTFALVGGTYTGANGITLSGTQFSPNYGTGANTICQGNDARLSDARAPTAHASTHAPGGADSLAAYYFKSLARTAVKTANYSVQPGELAVFDTTSGSLVATLPTAPADQAVVCVKQVLQGGANTVTYVCGGSDVLTRAGGPTSGTLSLLSQSVLLQYDHANAIWTVLSDDLPLGQLDARYVLNNDASRTLFNLIYLGWAR